MEKYIKVCDICIEDGENIIAVAEYTADDGEEYDCCKKHLEDVKGAKLKFELIDEEL